MNERFFSSEYDWNISGSEGRDFLGGRFQKFWRDETGLELLIGEVSMVSRWPDRSLAKYSYIDPPKDVVVILSQVIMAAQLVHELISKLNGWLETAKDVDINLCPEQSDQKFSIVLAPTEIPNSLKKVSCQIEYLSGNFSGKWSFEVDQSCIRIFVEELTSSLKVHNCKTE